MRLPVPYCAVLLAAGLLRAVAASAGVLPEDRADAMYHRYDGGDVTVDGPSILVRKKFGEQVSVSANYYVDMVTSASIDVKWLSGASEYKEERAQTSFSADYLRGKSTYSISLINSKESDYVANTASFGISEDMFGDLTTVSLGFSRAKDEVYKNVSINGVKQHDPVYGKRRVDHRSYRLGISQVLTKHLIVGLNYEAQTHQGELGNPYRAIRSLSLAGNQALIAPEIYPNTRTTNAVAIDARYYLPYRAALKGSYRFFADTWGVAAHTAEIGYTHPWRAAWIFEGSYRHHRQSAADFYSDLFPRPNFQNFMARDRNLATMQDHSLHAGVSYELEKPWPWLEKGSVNLFIDRIQFRFADFRDATRSQSDPTLLGREPLHRESALVARFFVSVWF